MLFGSHLEPNFILNYTHLSRPFQGELHVWEQNFALLI